MSDKVDRYEIEENMYVLDSSASASEGERMKRLTEKFSEEVEESFDLDKLHDPETDDTSRD